MRLLNADLDNPRIGGSGLKCHCQVPSGEDGDGGKVEVEEVVDRSVLKVKDWKLHLPRLSKMVSVRVNYHHTRAPHIFV